MIDDGRPIAHAAAEAGIVSSTLSKRVHRYRTDGPEGLEDRSSAPAARRIQLATNAIELVDTFRRYRKLSARRVHTELLIRGHHCCVRTVSRWLDRVGINRRRDLDPTGENNR